ncbi:hypothetical protein C8R44DRAFT_733074 [Mycena epipterygia]|nr:hypothetical protein C8R44DRAFT_733074 [Mycena epipterygia]
MLVLVCNCTTNVMPLLLGLFFKISGTSSCIIQMLTNVGVCVSGDTIEPLKVRISEDAISMTIQLITSGQVFFTISVNINIFLYRSQQWLSNMNNMINATNCAIIGITNIEPFTTANLAEKFTLHRKKLKTKTANILPMAEDDEIVG